MPWLENGGDCVTLRCHDSASLQIIPHFSTSFHIRFDSVEASQVSNLNNLVKPEDLPKGWDWEEV
jgi:hypothetical protein